MIMHLGMFYHPGIFLTCRKAKTVAKGVDSEDAHERRGTVFLTQSLACPHGSSSPPGDMPYPSPSMVVSVEDTPEMQRVKCGINEPAFMQHHLATELYTTRT